MFKHNISQFNNCTDTKPKQKILTFDDLYANFLREHTPREEKDGPMFSGATYGPNQTRLNKNVTEVSIGIFDFDGVDPEPIRQILTGAGFRAAIVSTHSHSPESPCFRVVIPFTAPVPARLWPAAVQMFKQLFDDAIDPKTKAVSQAFYLPSCPEKNVPNAFSYLIEGECFDALREMQELGLADEVNTVVIGAGTARSRPTGSSSKDCPRQMAEEILRTLFNSQLKFFNYTFFAYEDGYWRALDRNVDVEQRILRTFSTLNVAAVKQIVDNLTALTFVKDIVSDVEDGGRLLCLNNGTLDLSTGVLLQHDPMHNLVNKMNVDWDPTARAPIFLHALHEMFKYDDDRETRIQFILEWFGYCLVPSVKQHKFLWLVGAGGNGKSILLNTLATLLGKDNVSYAMLERMGRPSVRAELQGKLCNISAEMSADATLADGYLKAIVAGDSIEAERKFQPPFSYQPYCRIVAATNMLPRLRDTTDGFFRRAIILELTRTFKDIEMDKDLQQKILGELDGILVLAVNGLKALLARGEFVIPDSASKTANKYRDESDSVRYFVKDACRPDPRGTKPAALYEQYRDYAARFRFPALNLIRFGKQLSNLGTESRDSNGTKFWLVSMKAEERERPSRTTLMNTMEEET
jgi:P4 family phage/plasmid primase-like protien